MTLRFTETGDADLNTALSVELDAFDDDASIRTLVSELHADATAAPLISLVAWQGEEAVGHVLLTAARLEGDSSIKCTLLAPLAIRKAHQKQGIGQQLTRHALHLAKERGFELVFVLGHPTYYPRLGFAPAFPLGFSAPYPIESKNEDAWMVQELKEGALRGASGQLGCADALMQAHYWVE